MDSAVTSWLNRLAAGHEGLTPWVATQMAVVLLGTFAVGWVVLALRAWRRERRLPWRFVDLGMTAVLAVLGLVANQVVGHLWSREQPYAALAGITALLPPSGDPSFPSDHATGAIAIAVVVLAARRAAGAVLLARRCY